MAKGARVLTGGRPRFTGGTLLVDDYDRGADLFAPGAHLHGVRDRQLNKEGARSPACCCEPRSDGTMRCNNFVIFPYLVIAPSLVIAPPLVITPFPGDHPFPW